MIVDALVLAEANSMGLKQLCIIKAGLESEEAMPMFLDSHKKINREKHRFFGPFS